MIVSLPFHEHDCCSVAQSCPTLCNSMDCSTPGFPVFHYLLEFAQTHVHWVDDAIQLSHPLLPPSPPVLNLSQHQNLFQWVSSLHHVTKVLELQLQPQSFQWIAGLISSRIDWLDLLAVQGTLESLLQNHSSMNRLYKIFAQTLFTSQNDQRPFHGKVAFKTVSLWFVL